MEISTISDFYPNNYVTGLTVTASVERALRLVM